MRERVAAGLTPLPVLHLASVVAWGLAAALVSAAVAAVLAGGAVELLRRGGLVTANFRGLDLPAGIGLLLPLASSTGTGLLVAAGLLRAETAWLLVGGAFALALVGLIDDLAGGGEPKGWVGHGRALAAGRFTAGSFKALTGLTLAALAALSGLGWAGAAAVALGPNAVNTLDVRPCRATAFTCLAALVLLVLRGVGALLPLAPLLGALLALAPGERRQAWMLGDAGANAAGFVIACAWAFAAAGGPFALTAGLVVIVGDRVHVGRFGLHAARGRKPAKGG